MLKRPIEIFIRRLKQVLSVALHDTGSQRVQWRRPSTCCFSASFVWLHAPSAGLLMMTNVSRLLVEVCSHKKPSAHRVMRFSGARQSVSSASNVQVFQSYPRTELKLDHCLRKPTVVSVIDIYGIIFICKKYLFWDQYI